jgi:hypothetical protein
MNWNLETAVNVFEVVQPAGNLRWKIRDSHLFCKLQWMVYMSLCSIFAVGYTFISFELAVTLQNISRCKLSFPEARRVLSSLNLYKLNLYKLLLT